jgi:hypothetical protein
MASLLDSPIGLRAAAWTELFPASTKTPQPAPLCLVEHRCPNSSLTCTTTHHLQQHPPQLQSLASDPIPPNPPTQPPCRAPSRSKAARATLPHRESSSSSYHHHNYGHTNRLIVCCIACSSLHRSFTVTLFTSIFSHFYHQQPTPPIDTMVTRPTPTTANAMDSRTPQNTPAQNAPISSRAQAPSVSDIKEGWSSPTRIQPSVAIRTLTNNFHRHRGP